MPYQRNTARQFRRHVITYGDVCQANEATTSELQTLGFWSGRLENVKVYWTAASLICYGWY